MSEASIDGKRRIEAEVTIKVPFHDVDSMAITWHGNYIKYFEVARCALLDLISYNYSDMVQSKFDWPIIEVKARYIRPTVFGQNIVVKAVLTEFENRLKINYMILDEGSGARLVKGHTVQVAVDAATGEMLLASPKALRDKIEGLL